MAEVWTEYDVRRAAASMRRLLAEAELGMRDVATRAHAMTVAKVPRQRSGI
jgi:hypothetical protein